MPNYTLIGIGGGSASGKSMVAAKIAKLLGEERTAILEMDSYYKDHSHLSAAEREQLNFDHPQAMDLDLFKEHLKILKSGRGIDKPVYNFHLHKLEVKTVRFDPKPFVIIDGLFILMDPFNDELHYRIYIDASEKTRLQRRLARDTRERERTKESVLKQFGETVKPMHERFIAPSAKNADVVISWEKEDLETLEKIVQRIKAI